MYGAPLTVPGDFLPRDQDTDDVAHFLPRLRETVRKLAPRPPVPHGTKPSSVIIIIIFGVVPLRGFPVGRRGIGCRVPILGGRRLAGLVRLVGMACPSRGCQAGMAVQLVGPAPTPHGAQGGRRWRMSAASSPSLVKRHPM